MRFSKGRLEIKEIERKINVEKGVESKKWRIDFLLSAERSACESKEATSVFCDGRWISYARRLIARVEIGKPSPKSKDFNFCFQLY
jgi:hypothetical protein